MIDDLLYTDKEIRENLKRQSDLRLLLIVNNADQDIKSGRDFASIYQTWSIGVSILKERGFEILRTTDIQKYIEKLGGR